MKEIDFIPQWYRSGRQKKVSYKRQYTLVVGVFVAMMTWSFVTGRMVSGASADINRMQSFLHVSAAIESEYQALQADIKSLRKKTDILEQLAPRADISALIAELSYLVGENIVLERLAITDDEFADTSSSSKGIIKLADNNQTIQNPLPKPNRRLKVVIAGIAADATDVAGLISKLEHSCYFHQVLPVFSRTKDIKNHRVTEFELTCFVADYKTKREKPE